MQSHIEQLNQQFAIPGQLRFETGPGGLATAVIENSLAAARMTLAGGQVMAYQTREPGSAPLLWASPRASASLNGAMRGGAPICWPWFGPHRLDPKNQPLHGLVRSMIWSVSGTRALEDGSTEVAMRISSDAQTLEIWPYEFELEVRAVFGARLRLAWMARNTSNDSFRYTGAIHPYYVVSDVREISLCGLENTDYLDKNQGFQRKTQPDQPLCFDGPVDRVYLDTLDEVVIHDPGLRRALHIAKRGSRTTVVWNPHEADALMDDVGAGQHRNFVCAEAANAFDDAVTVAPGGEAHLSMEIWSEALAA